MPIISAKLIKNTFCDYECEICGNIIPKGGSVVRILTREPKPFHFICLKCAEGMRIDRDILEGVK